MVSSGGIVVPNTWQNLAVNRLRGTMVILGGPGSGKSTLARYLYHQFLAQNLSVAYLAADVGQQELGPPTTMAVALSGEGQPDLFPPGGQRRMVFVGGISPRGSMIQVVVGIHRLHGFAAAARVDNILVDTSGFIEADQGAAALKWALIDLLKPGIVIALQQDGELEPILEPLRPIFGNRLKLLQVDPSARHRSPEERKARRQDAYREYFQDAQQINLALGTMALFPQRSSSTTQIGQDQLVALEDRSGFALALGIVIRHDTGQQALRLLTPWWGQGKIASVRIGGLRLDPASFEEERV